jgi:para-nitrobenzyl esterase
MADADGKIPGEERPVVRMPAGVVSGRHEDGLDVFRGIRFAEPPVGDLRFAAPLPASPWTGVRDAAQFGPPPPQDVGAYRDRLPEGYDPLAAERGREGDWLTVNVWTPSTGAVPARPVMVWIYGGAYKVGSADSPGYDAQRIAREGDVVVVTFNYRVGIEGFAVIDGAPANRGLLDQVAALEWVRDNIAAFGGDPREVTVFGESAGAGSVASLLAMPRASGLLRRAIVQSMPGTFLSRELGAAVGRAIAAERGLQATVADLAMVPPHELVLAGETLAGRQHEFGEQWGQLALHDTLFAPVVDGDVLPVTPWEALSSGAARDVDLVIGHTRDECRLFLVMSGRAGSITEEEASRALSAFGPGQDGSRYRAAFPDATAEQLYVQVRTDWLFRMPALQLAEAQTAGGGGAYLYELAWKAPGAGGLLGACHGIDLPLLFGTFGASLGPLLFGPEPAEEAYAAAAQLRRTWTTFAKSGDPGWPAYDPEHRPTQVFDDVTTVAAYPEEQSRLLWQDVPFSTLQLLEREPASRAPRRP